MYVRRLATWDGDGTSEAEELRPHITDALLLLQGAMAGAVSTLSHADMANTLWALATWAQRGAGQQEQGSSGAGAAASLLLSEQQQAGQSNGGGGSGGVAGALLHPDLLDAVAGEWALAQPLSPAVPIEVRAAYSMCMQVPLPLQCHPPARAASRPARARRPTPLGLLSKEINH